MSWDPDINQDKIFKIEIEQHIYSSFQVRKKKHTTKYSSRCLERERELYQYILAYTSNTIEGLVMCMQEFDRGLLCSLWIYKSRDL